MKAYLELFISFAKIGLLTFGGGYAMLPILERVCVREKGWVTEDEMLSYYAIGQCTPGVIAVNTATFIGLKQKKTAGGIIATLGIVFPSLVVIMIIAAFINGFSEFEILADALGGIRIAVCALVSVSIFKLVKKSIPDMISFAVFGLCLAAALYGLSPVITVAVAGTAGVITQLYKGKL